MRWINSLERRFGSLAIPGLIRVIVAINAVVFVMIKTKPEFLGQLTLVPEKVMAGEVWRLVSCIFIPRFDPGGTLSTLWVILYLSLLWTMGEGLEQAWGSFKLNLFYFLGMLGTTVAVLVLGGYDPTGIWLNASVLFAFATLFPNFPILIYFVLPVRAKWIALFTLGSLLLDFLRGDPSFKAAIPIFVALANYLFFFGREWVGIWREQERTMKRRQQFQVAQQRAVDETLHHCRTCGCTEVSAPDQEFRVASDGEEYCLPHLPARKGEVNHAMQPQSTGSKED